MVPSAPLYPGLAQQESKSQTSPGPMSNLTPQGCKGTMAKL